MTEIQSCLIPKYGSFWVVLIYYFNAKVSQNSVGDQHKQIELLKKRTEWKNIKR